MSLIAFKCDIPYALVDANGETVAHGIVAITYSKGVSIESLMEMAGRMDDVKVLQILDQEPLRSAASERGLTVKPITLEEYHKLEEEYEADNEADCSGED